MSYALFLKQEPETNAKKAPEPDIPEEKMPDVEDLKALMTLMVDDYFVIVDYFDEKGKQRESH